MNKRNYIIVLAFIFVIILLCLFIFNKKNNTENVISTNLKNELSDKKYRKNDSKSKIDNNKFSENGAESKVKHASLEYDANYVKKVNLFDKDSNAVIPLSTISIIADLPLGIQEKVMNIADSSNIYMSKKSNDKLVIITDNPDNIRHSIEFIEISLTNGHQIKTTLGYNDKIKDSDNDIWEYSDSTKMPIRHSKYNNEGDIEFTEVWNYDDNPIKYEMKDAAGNVLSLRKETLDDGTNLRVEHLIYDKSGNTKVNVSATYDGADVKRFTYYNADKPSEGGSVFTEYTDGLKTKEIMYSNDLKVVNSYTSEYKNGEREDITVFDSKNNQIIKLIPIKSEESL